MALATVSSRIALEDKIRFDEFCENVGLTTSAALNLFIKAVLRENKIPFEIMQKEDPFYSKSNQEYLRESIAQLNEGKVVVKTMAELEAMADA